MKLITIFITLFFSVCAMAQEKIVVTQNVSYDNHKSCVMDIAQPVSQSKELRPAIIIVHGGGWAAGDKRDAVYTNMLVDYVIKSSGQHGFAYDQGLEIVRPAMDAFYAKHLKHEEKNLSWLQIKTPDGGGSDPYKAVALKEKSLTDFVVYRPLNIKNAVRREGKLPILLFANS